MAVRFIGRNLDTDLGQIAYELKGKLEFDLKGEVDAEPVIMHLAGFADVDGQWMPQVALELAVRSLLA